MESRMTEILGKYRNKKGCLLPVLQDVKEQYGVISEEAMQEVAEELSLPLSQVYEVVSFYPVLSDKQKALGRYCKGEDSAETVLLSEIPDNGAEYLSLQKALQAPENIIPTLEEAALLGRSGSGFPVSKKWELVRNTGAAEKYVICNASEGEPGTGKDMLLLERAPQRVIEGMIICAVAVGAEKGILYLREGEADVEAKIRYAIENAYQKNRLGEKILGTPYRFDIELRLAGGAYVCGEETGLLESLEGHRGEPRLKPPFPGTAGLWGMPTIINNAETFANVPVVVELGAEQYRKCGASSSSGTKLFTLEGDINRPGVYEFPFGVSMRYLFEQAGGGCPNGKALKGVQIGGAAAGTIAGCAALDIPLDIESCGKAGLTLGTGSLHFFDEDTSVVALCRDCMHFFVEESCGKCTPCRLGCRHIEDVLERLLCGQGTKKDITDLEETAEYIKRSANCGLGQMASAPVISALANFRDEFEACTV